MDGLRYGGGQYGTKYGTDGAEIRNHFFAFVKWTISCTHTAIAIWLAFQDEDYRLAHSYYRMTTKTNGGFLLATQYVLLALDVVTVIVDYLVLRANRRHIKK